MRITSTLSLAVALTFTVSATAQMSTYSTFGTAEAMGEGCVELTTGEEGSAGAVWANELIDLTQPFHLQARINFGSVPHGAEGVVCTSSRNRAAHIRDLKNHPVGVVFGFVAFLFRSRNEPGMTVCGCAPFVRRPGIAQRISGNLKATSGGCAWLCGLFVR